MLLSKKLIHLFNISKNQHKIKKFLDYSLLYINIKQVFLFYIGLIFLKFFKKKLSPLYVFLFEIIVPDFMIFNRVLFKLFGLLKTIDLKIKFTFNSVNKFRKYYIVLRSPFVYKKSREQFIIEKIKGFFFFNIGHKNTFSVKYLEFFFRGITGFSYSSKVLIKKFIFLK